MKGRDVLNDLVVIPSRSIATVHMVGAVGEEVLLEFRNNAGQLVGAEHGPGKQIGNMMISDRLWNLSVGRITSAPAVRKSPVTK